MSYLMQAKLVEDSSLLRRVTACAATEGIPDPSFWVQQRAWLFSARPGWVEAYTAASLSASGPPGADEEAITDVMILAAVQALREQNE